LLRRLRSSAGLVLRRLPFAGAAVLALLVGRPSRLAAQGVTTGAVSGRVSDDRNQPLGGASITVVNRTTGFATSTLTRGDGRYLVQGLEVGGPYTVSAAKLGFLPRLRDGQTISLSQILEIDFRLVPRATVLGPVAVLAESDPVLSPERTGAATTISDSLLRRLPTLNRNFTDFVMLAPQVSTAGLGGGPSGAGMNNRFNSIQIDGASETDLFGLGGTGQPGGQAGGRSIGLEAVKAYQVLLAPYDVRSGNFTGLLVNAVTRHGTNDLTGTAFYVARTGGLARDADFVRGEGFHQAQYGFALGGPIVKDKIHFFVSPELQARREPAVGPFLGSEDTPFAASPADVERFRQLLAGYGIAPGTAGRVRNENPLANVFVRLDIALPTNSRLVLRHNYGHAEQDVFSREPTLLRLSSNAFEFTSKKHATVAQLYTNFAGGGSNELIVGYTRIRDDREPSVVAPQVSVAAPSTAGPGAVTLRAGAENSSQGTTVNQDVIELTDDYTVQLGTHRLTVGTKNELYRIRNRFAQNSFGQWEFTNLDAFESGVASRYQVGVSLGDEIAPDVGAVQLGAYVQDRWEVRPRFAVTLGLRADMPWLRDKPPFNPAIFQELGRRTDDIPSANVQLSPRVAFNWDVDAHRNAQLRGGIGVFVGPPPFVWLTNAFQNSGLGLGQLTCQGVTGGAGGGTPRFPGGDPAEAPHACADGSTAASSGDINLLSPDLRFPQVMRTSLAFDRRFGDAWVATIEGMYSRAMSSFFYVNRALAGPQGVDRNGRTIYGTIAANGVASPALVASRRAVIDVENAGRDWAYALTAQIQRQFTRSFEASAAYTYSEARDIQSLTSSVAFSNWRFGRAISGDQRNKSLSRSRFETPHRVVVAGTYTLSTRTDISAIYIGQSGTPYDYVYGGTLGGGRGDLNADGAVGNDLVYVPQNAADTTQIRFSGLSGVAGADNSPAAQRGRVAAQQIGFQRFIEETPCLSRQRGRLLARNSCRAPWTNVLNVAIRQALPAAWGHSLSAELGVFNFLNLLNRQWGEQPLLPSQPPIALLDHVAQTPGALAGASGSQGVFTFDPGTQRFTRDNLASGYQMQLGVRYTF
jgi:carboxypeptidase family protein